MTRKKPVRKTAARSPSLDATPRHLWLASLGLLVAGRREGRHLLRQAQAKAATAADDARKAIRQAEAGLRGGLGNVRQQVEPKVQSLGAEVEARLAPIVAKLGLKPAGKRTPRKARKAPAKAVRRVARKPVRRVARKTAR
ncbi:hypothetical protein [Thermomonas sp.]|uniref:hypothetical protein n=1 Tax=Thermomonas sp. TaxID=1971895 RepID=UPI0035B44199